MLNGALPLIGHLLELSSQPARLFGRGRASLGDVFSIKFPGFGPTVVLTGERNQETYFRLRSEDFSVREAYRLMNPIFGKGVLYDVGPRVMREQVGFLQPMLSRSRLASYIDGFNDEIERYFGDWDSGVADLLDVGNELTLRTSGRALFGAAFTTPQVAAEFCRLLDEMQRSVIPLAMLAPRLPIPRFRRRDKARTAMMELVSTVVTDSSSAPGDAENFLQALQRATYRSGRRLTLHEITGLVLAAMFAGNRTSGATFAWTGIELGRHPHIMRAVRAEQEATLPRQGSPTLEQLRHMVQLEYAIKETLRLHPPVAMLMRRLEVDLELDDWRIPRGTMVIAYPPLSHADSSAFAAPERFDPARFAPTRAEHRHHPYSWIAFGAGQHACLGAMFAQLQLQAIWSHLTRNFELRLADTSHQPDHRSMIAGPKQPCLIRYQRRGR